MEPQHTPGRKHADLRVALAQHLEWEYADRWTDTSLPIHFKTPDRLQIQKDKEDAYKRHRIFEIQTWPTDKPT